MSNIRKMVKTVLRVVLYLRLSKEDLKKENKEDLSESIKNQEIMLRQYAEEQGWEIVGVYNDEDWSGADSTRPEFNKMIAECEKGNVDIVLCKTQARFARDMELIEKYLYDKFIEWGVQFRTVVDRIDNTKRETKKTSQILGLTDQWYLEDTSYNIRQTLRSKREEGQFTGSFAPYGYLIDPENKNHLVIDYVTSDIVKQIYQKCIDGKGFKTISDELNNNNVLSPFEYKLMNGSKLQIPFISNYMYLDAIKNTGSYKIDVYYTNKERQVLHNLVSYSILTENGKVFDNKCKLYLRRYTENKMNIYYTNEKDIDFNNFNVNNWIKLNIDDELPKDTTCIATITDTLDRTHTINYQLEVVLEENLAHKEYKLNVISVSNDEELSNLDFNIVTRKKYKWCDQMIKKILTDETYTGCLIQFRTTRVSYKNRTKIYNDEEDWIKVENTHDAIIDKDLWNKVQTRVKKRTRSCKNGKVQPFANKIFCMNCGKVFCKRGTYDKKNYGYLGCRDFADHWTNCDNKKTLNEGILHSFVIEKINNLLDRFYDEEYQKEFKKNDIENDLFAEKLNSLNKELNIIEKELQSKKVYLQKLFEDKINGILDEDEFLLLKTKYKEDTIKLEDRKKSISEEIKNTNQKKSVLKDKNTILSKYKHIEEISTEIVHDFIDKVIVGNYDKETDSRDIKIVWNFVEN